MRLSTTHPLHTIKAEGYHLKQYSTLTLYRALSMFRKTATIRSTLRVQRHCGGGSGSNTLPPRWCSCLDKSDSGSCCRLTVEDCLGVGAVVVHGSGVIWLSPDDRVLPSISRWHRWLFKFGAMMPEPLTLGQRPVGSSCGDGRACSWLGRLTT